MPPIRPRSTLLPGDTSSTLRGARIAAFVLAVMAVGHGLAGATPTDDSGQSVSSGSSAGSATSQSTRPESVAERVVVKVRRLDLTRLPATEFGDGEQQPNDNRDQLP